MNLSKVDIDHIMKMISHKEGKEFEVRLKNRISYYDFEKILNKLIFDKSNGGLGLDYKIINELDISNNNGQRVTISDVNDIKRYWISGELVKGTYKTIKKEKEDVLDNKDYNIRFAVSNEHMVEEEVPFIGGKKTYRYKSRYSIQTSDKLFNIDMTVVKMAEGETFRESRVLTQVPKYEIELELVGDGDDIIDKMIANVGLILQLYYETDILMKIGEMDEVCMEYKKLVKSGNKDKKLVYDLKTNKYFFIAANPVTLQIKDIIGGGGVLNDYAISYKADGHNNFMYIGGNGEAYLINNEMNVRMVGVNMKNWSNSLIEGEYIYSKRLFLCYDMLFSKGSDIRNHFLRTKDGIKGRVDELNEFIKELNTSDRLITIILKPYMFNTSGKEQFFKLVNQMWTGRNGIDWDVDGLIFTPIWESYPNRSVSWNKLFKWKPKEYNSIDFLIHFVDGLKTTIVNGNAVQYKEVKLKVTGGTNAYNNGTWDKVNKPIDFVADGLDTNVVGIPLEYNGKLYAKEPKTGRMMEIMDNTIIEFTYNAKEEIFKWKPIRVRYDKTNRYQEGEKIFGNYEQVAKSIWESMNNEITEEMLTTGYIPETLLIEEKKGGTSYYKEFSKNTRRTVLQNFHNLVVKSELLESVNGSKLLDLGSGKGGDLKKWKNMTKVVGIELYKANIARANEYYKKLGMKTDVVFINGDVSREMFPNYLIAIGKKEQDRLKKVIPSKYEFDIVSCMFAMHYMYESEEMFNTFLKNVDDNLKVGGVFIGCCFDGERLFNALKGKKLIEGKDENGGVMWSIRKKYDVEKYEIGEANYGIKIEAYMNTFAKGFDENLVNFSYLETKLKTMGYEKVVVEGFAKIFDTAIKESKYKKILVDMTDVEKEFSFYNNIFIFRKGIEPKHEDETKEIIIS